MDLAERISRDEKNALRAQELARQHLGEPDYFRPRSDMPHGTPTGQLALVDGARRRKGTLRAIAEVPFHAMAEVEVTAQSKTKALWYANEHSECNEVLDHPDGDIRILAWTHPGFQLALAGELNHQIELHRAGYTLRAVRPLARARFRQVIPTVTGIYEPGGGVQETAEPARPAAAGLKAVKLDMTRDQIQAFIARMDGYLIVLGAPGTGKTTVAFQRIRFLLDQQELRDPDPRAVPYEPGLTRVFLANSNLIEYSRELLTKELGIPADVVSYVPAFIHDYADSVWRSKQNARLRTKRISEAESRARESFFNLCKVKDVRGVWELLETQVSARLKQASEADWMAVAKAASHPALAAARRLAEGLEGVQVRPGKSPVDSKLRMDSLYARVRSPYVACRESLVEKDRRTFDARFCSWLFWVYDPLDAMASYFCEHQHEGSSRIKNGTAELIRAEEVIERIIADWRGRQYGSEEESWIAWLLRFLLPEERNPEDRFREIPSAFPDVNHRTEKRWTHVVIDEVQDLSVQEASLLASFVHAKGSLTVSADFRQIVSPVHGMTDAEALKFGLPIWDQDAYMQYPFKKNMRQSREIGRFLVDFYNKTFQEFPLFDAGDREEGTKPVLYTGDKALFPSLIRQMMAVLSRSKKVESVALLQINEDSVAMHRLRTALEREGVPLAPPGRLTPAPGQLITTSVERAKGLEFDACIVLGLDDVERASLNFSKNRAYVALSRPTQRLFILCEQYPPLLQKAQKDLFEHRALR